MDCTFSPLTDFTKLEAAVSDFYGPAAAPTQSVRFRRLLDGLTETFGPQTAAAVFSAPGRSEIGGNHTDHQHGRVLAGSVDLDIIAAVAPNNRNAWTRSTTAVPQPDLRRAGRCWTALPIPVPLPSTRLWAGPGM